MFNETKYTKWYFRIIDNAKERNLEGYSEKHHIIPKSLGGNNKKSNLVRLTAREHYIVHLILMKMVNTIQHKHKMATAFHYMSTARNESTTSRYSSKLYEHHKKIQQKIASERFSGSNNPRYGKRNSDETRRKISEARKGINTNTEESLEKKAKNFKENNPMNDPVLREKARQGKSKEYLLRSPEGIEIRIRNLAEFCRKHSLSHSELISKSRKTKGWHLLEKL